MAFYPPRRTSHLTFVVLLAVIALLFPGLGLADGADDRSTVRYNYWWIEDPVRYGIPLHIEGIAGGFQSEYDESNNTFYQRLTGSTNDLGDTLSLVSNKVTVHSNPVYVNDVVHVKVHGTSAGGGWWGWRKEGATEWFLVETSIDKRAEFTIVGPTACPRLFYCYVLQSCPSTSCNNLNSLAPYPEDGVIYVKLGDKSSGSYFPVRFRQLEPQTISMPTDT